MSSSASVSVQEVIVDERSAEANGEMGIWMMATNIQNADESRKMYPESMRPKRTVDRVELHW